MIRFVETAFTVTYIARWTRIRRFLSIAIHMIKFHSRRVKEGGLSLSVYAKRAVQ